MNKITNRYNISYAIYIAQNELKYKGVQVK
jgi:hypothetical protein